MSPKSVPDEFEDSLLLPIYEKKKFNLLKINFESNIYTIKLNFYKLFNIYTIKLIFKNYYVILLLISTRLSLFIIDF